jgi:hypothetical protein
MRCDKLRPDKEEAMAAPKVKEGDLFQERTEGAKYPRIVRVRKVTDIGPNAYVYYMAENPAAQAIFPNGGMIPLSEFVKVWAPAKN